MKTAFFQLLWDEDGATMLEYALLIGLIAIVVAGAVTALQGGLSHRFTQAADGFK